MQQRIADAQKQANELDGLDVEFQTRRVAPHTMTRRDRPAR
ncbi:hypothetical protein [Paraburkholderia diazotrophica]